MSTEMNHSSARKFPNDIEVYLQEEKAFNTILAPFSEPLISDLHISPFLTREKTGANSHRVIVDLSFNPGSLVNAGVDPNTLGKGSLIYKIDISRAFRRIKIDPSDYNLSFV